MEIIKFIIFIECYVYIMRTQLQVSKYQIPALYISRTQTVQGQSEKARSMASEMSFKQD